MAPRALRPLTVLSCVGAGHAAFDSLRMGKAKADPGETEQVVGTVAGFAPSPGYAGSLKTTGGFIFSAYTEEDGTEGTRFSGYTLWDTDPACADGAARLRVAGACSIAVHVGGACDNAGAPYPLRQGPPWIPYTTVNRSVQVGDINATSFEKVSLNALVGKTLVVRDSAGTPVACAPLRLMEAQLGAHLTAGEWQKYPGYDGDLQVDVEWAGMMQVLSGNMTGQVVSYTVQRADPACASGQSTGVANSCGIHVHKGTDCTDASTIGGHFFNSSVVSEDPWALVRYTIGRGGSGALVMTELTVSELEGRALVVHDVTGARIACSILEVGGAD